LAIALGVALGFSVYLINRVAADEVQGASRSLFGLADYAVQAPGMGFDEALFPKLARIPGVAAASPVVELQVRLPGRERNLKLIASILSVRCSYSRHSSRQLRRRAARGRGSSPRTRSG